MYTNRKLIYSFGERLYRIFGLNPETVPGLWVILAGTVTVIAIFIFTDGNVLFAGAVVLSFALVVLTFYRLEYSFMVLVGCVLLFDQYHIPGFNPYTYRLDYFLNIKEISFLPSFNAGVVNPIELHFLLIFFIWFLMISIRKQFHFKFIPVWGSLTLLSIWFLFSFVYGMRGGGDILIAMWEVRALFYLAIMYLTIPQIIQDKRHLRIFLWIIIGTIAFKTFQGLARYASLGFTTAGLPTLTNHEDPVFMVTLLVLLLCFWLYQVKDSQKTALLVMLLPLILGFVIANRRAAMGALIVSVFALIILLPRKQQWTYFKYASPAFVILLIYGVTFWNIDHKIAAPVQMVKSGIERPDLENNPRDYYSNLYRDYENYNLAYTTRSYPVIGIGFGKQFEHPLRLAQISYPLRDYIPHNQIFWIIVKCGSVGFFLFWFFFNSFAYRAIQIRSRIEDPYLKSICTMVVIAIIAQMCVSYYDLQLTYYRNMIYLGTLMGLIPALGEIDEKERIKTKDLR